MNLKELYEKESGMQVSSDTPMVLKDYTEWLEQKAEAGEKAITENKVLIGCRDHWQASYNDVRKKYYLDSKRPIVQEEMYENSKCCGNCRLYQSGTDCVEWNHWNQYCDQYQSDQISRSQREIK